MAGFTASVDPSDAARVIARYERLGRRVQPAGLSVWLRQEAHPFLRDRAASRFAAEGDDASGKWEQLTRGTGFIRHNLGFAAFHPINVRTGGLKWFVLLTYTMKRTAQTATLTMPGKGDTRTVSKLRVAQKGGIAPRGKKAPKAGPIRPTPPRPVVALGLVDERGLSASLHEWLMR